MAPYAYGIFAPLSNLTDSIPAPSMPTDDSPRSINLARHHANAPLYSPTKVTRTYGRKSRAFHDKHPNPCGSASQPILLDHDDHSPDDQSPETHTQPHTKQDEEDQPASQNSPSFASLEQQLKDAREEAQCATEKLHSYLLRDAEELTCMICLELANRPYILPCHHFFCAECISLFANNLVQRRINFHCPYCQQTIGRFTPIGSLYMSARARTLREELKLSPVSRSSLTWPQEFTPPHAGFPFPDALADDVVIVLDF